MDGRPKTKETVPPHLSREVSEVMGRQAAVAGVPSWTDTLRTTQLGHKCLQQGIWLFGS